MMDDAGEITGFVFVVVFALISCIIKMQKGLDSDTTGENGNQNDNRLRQTFSPNHSNTAPRRQDDFEQMFAQVENEVGATNPADDTNSLLSITALKELFNHAFEKNQNQAVLEASRILLGYSCDKVHDEESQCLKCGTEDDEDDPSISSALQKARSLRQTTRKIHSDNVDDEKSIIVIGSNKEESLSRSLLHPRLPADHNRNDVYNDTVRGNCLICFEDFQVGETVVWSENEDCPHIFRKECMVNFLAIRQKDRQDRQEARDQPQLPQDNPCPACRLQFVTVNALKK